MHQGELALDDDGIAAIGSEAGEAGEDAAIAASGADASAAALAVGMAAGVSVVALAAGAADIEASSAFLLQAPSVNKGRARARHSAPCRQGATLLDDARNRTDSFDMKFSWSYPTKRRAFKKTIILGLLGRRCRRMPCPVAGRRPQRSPGYRMTTSTETAPTRIGMTAWQRLESWMFPGLRHQTRKDQSTACSRSRHRMYIELSTHETPHRTMSRRGSDWRWRLARPVHRVVAHSGAFDCRPRFK